MSIEKRFLSKFQNLSSDRQQEVLDFIEFLQQKEKKNEENLYSLMDEIIEDNREALEELSK
ncbi:DUF2281 domain-containing protein [Thalassobacillus sp. C254]|uniref:DUF2281 domain-containing protein n=1 Tax=Thalassobacillus sp. C254 TaxID=1225341 RepID=UPI0006D0369B|nr:DUF2281 domain-containing protein [Thalassobacillus sp. C254]